MKQWHKWVASVGGAGFLPIAPGTWGAGVGAVALFCLSPLDGLYLHVLLFFAVVFCTWQGARVAHALEPEWGEDPKPFVLDEVVGMWLAVIGHALTPLNLLLGFLLFRVFDILKPFGIRRLERIPNGWGVMLDDVAAGVAANLVLWVVLYFFLNV